jgi:small subunit ribosomal protein S7
VPRYGMVPKKEVVRDPLYGSALLQKFVNKLMLDGKKSLAEKIIYSALEEVQSKLNKDPIEVFEKALGNVTPILEVKARRVGGATYQVPIEVSRKRGQAIAIQWIRDAARERASRSMVEGLALELLDAYNGVGAAIKKREDLHKTAEANKAFAHFRW